MGFIKETTLFAANLEKDLAGKDIEYGKLVDNLLLQCLGEDLDDLPEDGDVFFAAFRRKYHLLKLVFQKLLVVNYDFFVRSVLFGNTYAREEDIRLAKEKGLLTKIPAEELYSFFIHFNSDASYVLFRDLDCPLTEVELLRTSLADGNKDLFVETFNRIKCDKSSIYFVAGSLGTIFEFLLSAFVEPQDVYNYLYCTIPNGIPAIIRNSVPGFKEQIESYIKSYKGDDNVDENKRLSSKEELQVLEQNALQSMDGSILTTLSSVKQVIIEMERVSELFPFEKAYVDSIVNNPELQPYFERLQGSVENPALTIEQPETSKEESSIAPESVGSFALPSHFFKLSIDLSNSDEFLVVKHEVEKGGTKLFASLIDYIASQGYIDNNDRTKRLLVYTLTGRWRPDDYQSGETIIWKDNGNEGKELCYIIKSIIASNKKEHKYDKMHKFFTGPNWSKTVPDKDQGNNASKKFKEALHDRYPTICKL